MKNYLTLKIGGAYLNAKNLSRQRRFLHEITKKYNVLMVVSALKGITRWLEVIVFQAIKPEPERHGAEFKEDVINLILKKIESDHLELISKLFLEDDQEKARRDFIHLFAELPQVIKSFQKGDNEDKFYSLVVSYGEKFSADLLSNFLLANNIHCTLLYAGDYLKTKPLNPEDNYRNERLFKLDLSFSSFSPVGVINGFIAKNERDEDTTLGLDGSDLSAAYFAVGLLKKFGTSTLRYLKDSDLHKEDPHVNPEAEKYSKITLKEYLALPTHPIRPDAVKYAVEGGVKVYMQNFLNPDGKILRIY